MTPPTRPPTSLPALLGRLAALAQPDDALPPADTPLGRVTREFFDNGWRDAQRLLARTDKLRVERCAPHVFRFEVDARYKRKAGPDSGVELCDGPVRGMIHYRTDLFASCEPDEVHVAVLLDPGQAVFHPNHARSHGVLCIGHVPAPFPLDALLEHLYRILTYQNVSTADPADAEAAVYFATQPEAMAGLEPVEPLF